LDELGLVEAVRSECEKFQIGFEIPVQFEAASAFPEPGKEAAICLYRLVQEALRNIRKHAKADYVTLSLGFQKDAFTLDITDNGIGIDLNSIRKKGGLGLASMAERVDLLHGKLAIVAQPQVGNCHSRSDPSVKLNAIRTVP